MFTGLITACSTVRSMSGGSEKVLTIDNPWKEGVAVGDSIAVDGACLTVTALSESHLSFFVSAVTLRQTVIGSYSAGTPVNVELALRVGDRLHGHFVQGHVDTVATVENIRTVSSGKEVSFAVPVDFAPHLIARASVAVQGVSLTMAAVTRHSFTVSLIPETLSGTTFGMLLRPNTRVNVEFDILGKYALSSVKNPSLLSLTELL